MENVKYINAIHNSYSFSKLRKNMFSDVFNVFFSFFSLFFDL